MNKTLLAYCQLMRLDRPIGTLLLLWPTLWALWLTGQPSPYLVTVFVLGVFVMRAAGCVINDLADRNFDGHVERTKQRPLVNGRITVTQAKRLFIALVFCAFLLVLTLNRFAIFISFLALISAVVYPFMKRYTHLPQLVLGIAFSWGIPMAYAATIETLPPSCWLLCLANIAWTVAYDTQYAMTDREDDLKIGIKSTAILFGKNDKAIIAALQIFTIACLGYVGLINQLSFVYFILLAIGASLFVYQQKIIRDRIAKHCFTAFLNNNYFGLLVFIGILLA